MLKVLLLSLSLLLLPISGTSEEFPVLDMEVLPAHQFEPGTIRYKMTVQPNYENTRLCYGYEQPNKFRRSCFNLYGIYSPRIFWQEYDKLPTASYIAFSELYRTHGIASRKTKEFTVLESDH